MPVRAVNRKDNPSSPPKNRGDAASTRQTRSARPTPSQEAQNTTLQQRQRQRQNSSRQAVTEENVTEDPTATQLREAEDDFAQFSPEDATDPESESSGEAALSSAGSDEFDALVVSDIVANLPVIDNDAQQVLNFIRPDTVEQLARDVRESASMASRRFRNAQSRLRQSVEPCAPRQLIDLYMIARRIGGLGRQDDLPLGPSRQRTAPIFAKANLALFLSRLVCLSMRLDGMGILELLFHLVSVEIFPHPFGFDDTSLELPASTKTVAVDILTQAYIAGAHARAADPDRPFDPEESLEELFGATPGERAPLSDNVDEDLLKARYNEIGQHLPSRKRKLDLGKLRQRFPFEQFIKSFSAWTKQAELYLNQQTNAQGGAEAIADKIESGDFGVTPSPELNQSAKRKSRSSEEIRRQFQELRPHFVEADRANAPEADQEIDVSEDDGIEIQETVPSPSRRANRPTEVGESPNALSPNRSRKTRSYEPLTEVPQEDVPTVGSDWPRRDDTQTVLSQELGADAQDESVIPTQATAAILAVEARQQRESNKENIPQKRSLLDRQEGAVRMEWRSPEPSSAVKGKRPIEDTDDDDFQDDTRQKKPRRSEYRPPKSKSPLFVPEDTSESEVTVPGPSATQPTRPRPVAFDRALPPPSTAPPASIYDEVKSLARTNTNYLKSVAPLPTYIAPTQSRRAWTADEIECLIEMIAKHGCGWARILKADQHSVNPRLQGRSQVQLKDKARNMKMDYLKAEMPLPENFAWVTISKSHKEELDRLGLQRGREGRFEDGFVLED